MLNTIRSLFSVMKWSTFTAAFLWIATKLAEGSGFIREAYDKGRAILASVGMSATNCYELLTGFSTSGEQKTVQVFPEVVEWFSAARSSMKDKSGEMTKLSEVATKLSQPFGEELGLGELDDVVPIVPNYGYVQDASSSNANSGSGNSANLSGSKDLTITRENKNVDKWDLSMGQIIFAVLAVLIGLVALERNLPTRLQFLQPVFDRLGIFKSWFSELLDEVEHGESKFLDRRNDKAVIRATKIAMLEALTGLKGRKVGGYPAILVLLRLLDEVSEEDIFERERDLERADFSRESTSLRYLLNG